MSAKLIKRVVEPASVGESDALLYDTIVEGFGIRIGRGGSRAYFVDYRSGRCRRRFTVVTHGSPGTVETARTEAVRVLGAATQGEDPVQCRLDDRRAMTVAELCDVCLVDGCEMKKASTIAIDVGRIERHIKPLLGRLEADDAC